MFLLVESGSTKSDWVIMNERGEVQARFDSKGFNPNFHSAEWMKKEMASLSELNQHAHAFQHIAYYGAGCSAAVNQATVSQALKEMFPNAQIVVKHDLEGAVWACTQGKAGFACILGTGSNAACFNGQEIESLNGGFGYILGDEGSGTHLGKKLLSMYLYDQLDRELKLKLEAKHQLTKDEIIQRVYRMPDANVYLAAWSRFIKQNEQHPQCQEMISTSLEAFLQLHILPHPQAYELPVHFVGSIAHHFQGQLTELCNKLGLKRGVVIQSPIDGLIHYHQPNNKN